jgi:ubiquinone/menaquinone biosynthesis C-methylase UbiE
MRINTNNWNKIRYTLYTPIYNLIVRYFKQQRKNSIDGLNFKEGHKILIIGAGTGLDIQLLPSNVDIFATDITPSMIEWIKASHKYSNKKVHAMVMDGQALNFENEYFDIVILH